MPFTLSHPAAVIPLSRVKWLVPSAVLMGSMAPDFPYFLALSMGPRLLHAADLLL